MATVTDYLDPKDLSKLANHQVFAAVVSWIGSTLLLERNGQRFSMRASNGYSLQTDTLWFESDDCSGQAYIREDVPQARLWWGTANANGRIYRSSGAAVQREIRSHVPSGGNCGRLNPWNVPGLTPVTAFGTLDLSSIFGADYRTRLSYGEAYIYRP